ncbi:response regulator [Acidisphaera sp. L21]|jgi:CheY-like chemotaxis protein|uniref:response regulator n=1 Tax=Acidisphaera sp. L21 TaxID=1641851 RepID=UPI00131C0389|nr:response regulator [Acidisphaera sp. L21]
MVDAALRALVAEDDPIVRMLMVETLEDGGYEVLEASDGVDAFRLMDEPDSVDFIVTDYHMPGFSGVEVAKRARERHPAIPVLFVSARVDILANAGAPHPFTVLKKPFTMAELGAAVSRLVEHSN